MSEQSADSKWSGRTDGLPWMHRSLIFMLRFMPVDVLYLVVDVVVFFYVLFAKGARSASMKYFAEVFHKNKIGALWHTYLQFRQLGQVVIDRFAAYAGQRFKVKLQYEAGVHEAMLSGRGCVMLSAHVGNYEMAGYFWRPVEKMYVLAYGGEKGTVLENRRRMLQRQGIEMLVAGADWSYLYAIRDALQRGEWVALFGDRNFGSEKTLRAEVLGRACRLPKGPFMVAKQGEETQVICAFVMKRFRKRYTAHVHLLKGETAQALAQQYADRLTDVVRKYPHQWFNFFDFWQVDEAK